MARTWTDEARRCGLALDVISHGRLSSADGDSEDDAVRDAQILALDESHNFLSKDTKRTPTVRRDPESASGRPSWVDSWPVATRQRSLLLLRWQADHRHWNSVTVVKIDHRPICQRLLQLYDHEIEAVRPTLERRTGGHHGHLDCVGTLRGLRHSRIALAGRDLEPQLVALPEFTLNYGDVTTNRRSAEEEQPDEQGEDGERRQTSDY